MSLSEAEAAYVEYCRTHGGSRTGIGGFRAGYEIGKALSATAATPHPATIQTLDDQIPSSSPVLERNAIDLTTPYMPVAIYMKASDTLEFVQRDVPTVSRPVQAGLDLLVTADTREPIGWRIFGWSRIAPPVLGVGREDIARGVYVASRASVLARGEMWRRLRADGAPIISTWIDEDGENDTADLDELWVRINREVTSAAALILYVETDDFPLKGAFVEVGMAIAAGVPIFVVAPGVFISGRNQRPFGSWCRHPSVSFCGTVSEALTKADAILSLLGANK